jgi:hypothetical protein
MCSDQYRPGWRERNPIGTPPVGAQLQTRPCPLVPRTSFKVCQGPSTTGPMTVRVPGMTLRFAVGNAMG